MPMERAAPKQPDWPVSAKRGLDFAFTCNSIGPETCALAAIPDGVACS